MQDEVKTKDQLIIELLELRERVAELEGDKAEFKRAAEALWESEERYRTIMDQAADAIFVHDETGRILDVDPEGMSEPRLCKGGTAFQIHQRPRSQDDPDRKAWVLGQNPCR